MVCGKFKYANCYKYYKKISFIVALIGCSFAQVSPDKIELLLDSSYARITIADAKGSMAFAEEALTESKRINYSKGVAYSHLHIGQALAELGNYQEALVHLSQAVAEKYTASDAFLMSEVHRVRSRIYAFMTLYENSIMEQQLGLSYISKMKGTETEKKILTSLAYENIAITYSNLNKYDTSFIFLDKNEKLLLSMEESVVYPNLINLYAIMGSHYTELKQYGEAELCFRKSSELIDNYNYAYRYYTDEKWGDMEMARNQPDQALRLYFLALEGLETLEYTNPIPGIYQKISICYAEIGDEDNASVYSLKALEFQNDRSKESLNAAKEVLNDAVNKKKKSAEGLSKAKKISWVIGAASVGIVFLLIFRYEKLRKRKSRLLVKAEQQIVEEKSISLAKEQETQVLQQKVNEAFAEVVQLARDNNPNFFTRFQEVYPEVLIKILEIDPKLRVSELTLCAYIFLGFTTKDIAACTYKSSHTVRNRKYNLKKKLHIPAEEHMELWLQGLRNKD